MGYEDWQKNRYGNVVSNKSAEEISYAKTMAAMKNELELMPWGKYKDIPMRQVPESYLLFLYHKGDLKDQRIIKFIETNLKDQL